MKRHESSPTPHDPTPDDFRAALHALGSPTPSAEWRQRTLHAAMRSENVASPGSFLGALAEFWRDTVRSATLAPAGAGFAFGLVIWMALVNIAPMPQAPLASAPSRSISETTGTLAGADVASLVGFELFGMP